MNTCRFFWNGLYTLFVMVSSVNGPYALFYDVLP